jgi:hypothetical protein
MGPSLGRAGEMGATLDLIMPQFRQRGNGFHHGDKESTQGRREEEKMRC